MRAWGAVVLELVADRLPRLPGIVRPVHHLAEPGARLRCVQPVRISRRTVDVKDLPAGEMRTRDLPLLAAGVCAQDEGTLPRADQNPNLAHSSLPHHTEWTRPRSILNPGRSRPSRRQQIQKPPSGSDQSATVRTTFPVFCSDSTYRVASTTSSMG